MLPFDQAGQHQRQQQNTEFSIRPKQQQQHFTHTA